MTAAGILTIALAHGLAIAVLVAAIARISGGHINPAVIFAVAIDKKGLTHLAPMAIGLAYLVNSLVGISLTGASMNPARSFGPAVVANIWTDHWIYWLGPLIGAGVAALVYEFVFLQREEENGEIQDAI